VTKSEIAAGSHASGNRERGELATAIKSPQVNTHVVA